MVTAISISSIAQSPIDYVPADATFIMRMNPNNLNKKVALDDIRKMDFFQEMLGTMAGGINPMKMEEMMTFLQSPNSEGVDLMADSYAVFDINDERSLFKYIFKISDTEKATAFFKEQQVNPMEDMMGQGVVLKKKGAFDYLDMGTSGRLLWNDQVGIYVSGEVEVEEEEFNFDDFDFEEYEEDEDYDYDEENEEEVEDKESDFEVFEESFADKMAYTDSLNNVMLDNALSELIGSNINSIKQDARFVNDSQKSDFHMWMDYQYIQQMNMDNLPDEAADMGLGIFLDQMMGLYKDTRLSMDLNFVDGAMVSKIKTYMNPQMANLWSSTMDNKMNRRMHKYLKGDDLLGYFSANYSVEKSVEATKTMVYDMMDDIPFVGGMANSAMDIVGIMIDEEALYDLLKGDLVFNMTGLKDVEMEVVDYEYDEDFNRIEKKRMTTQKLPEFTMMMSYGNKDDMMKFVRLGEQFGTLQSNGDYYKIVSEELPMDVFMAMHKGIIFLTNDTDLIQNRLKKGFKRKNRIAKRHCKSIKNNASTFYWNIPATMEAGEEAGLPMDMAGSQITNMTKDTFKEIVYTASKTVENNAMQSTFKFNLGNDEQNALEQFFNYINDLYITMMGGQSM